MKRMSLSVILGLLLIGFTSPAMAHTLWINLYESYAHPPGHAIVSLGWGHAVPMDDLLVSKAGSIQLATFDLIDPELNRTALPMPVLKMEDVIKTSSGMTAQCGDMGIRKLSLTDKTKPGTYQVVAASKESYFTMYLDKKGKRKMGMKPLDEVRGAHKVLFSVKYKSFAKAFFAVKNWTDPKPLGFDLELMPMTDLSNLHVGDVVPFQITFMGKPFSCGADTIEYITATSNSFGGPDGFFLSAYIMNGKAQFRMPAAGQWVVNVYVRQEVTPESDLKELVGKCTTVYYASTISFNVKP
ncbi:MAG: DUF4198 domain-containing protein [Deltaproteobacteria bacterium]|nr:DUF4198 domain-containing protein [Deltaproteobacteria bacterium]MBW2105351.1 DUF4198 domain-containing protein [Deltaproteobacteria bacterium]